MTNDKQRERLVELLQGASKEAWCLINMSCCEEKLKLLEKIDELRADYLLENGAIVPPCKVGDVVYTFFCKEVDEGVVVSCEYSRASGFSYMSSNGKFPTLFNESNIGKSVFLTKEEAEKALKGGAE